MSNIDLWYATRATGIVALVLLTATVVLGISVAGRAASPRQRRGSEGDHLPGFAWAEVHKRISVLTVIFLAIHVVTAVVDPYVDIGWLAVVVPFTSPYHRLWVALGTASADLMLAVAVSSALRRRIPAQVWRAVHWLAYLSWPVGVAHALGTGTDAQLNWVLGLVAACIASVVAATAWRVAAALRARARRPETAISPRPGLLLTLPGRTEAAK